MSDDLQTFLEHVRPALEATLNDLIPSTAANPSRIHQAMRYSTLDGGKRIRPSLCVAAFSAYKDDWQPILPIASAIEMIHAYSLIHDDLPAMDDDDVRRGKPSCHRQFDEATAILAGDALLTLAFEALARCESFPANRLLRVVAALGHAAGTSGGMIAGQILDLEAAGASITPEQLEKIHRSKTGALIGVSVWIGAYLGDATERDLEKITEYCDRVGLAFQIVDDIIDAEGGRDREQQKATYPQLYGLEKSRAIVRRLMVEARHVVAPLGANARLLLGFCSYLEDRTH
jgi:geranylgeranyl pyrophosphate synthase